MVTFMNTKDLMNILDSLGDRIEVNHPSIGDLEERCRDSGRITEYDNLSFISSVRNRSAPLTVYVGVDGMAQGPGPAQQRILDGLDSTIEQVKEYLTTVPLDVLEFTMGANQEYAPRCHMYLSAAKQDYARLGLMAMRSYEPCGKHTEHHMHLINLPEWHETRRQMLMFPDDGLTLVLGSDYYGEVKKGFLRMAMYQAKQAGMLGLHAGAKQVTALTDHGLRTKGMLLFGLTATGKTTHTCHDHGLNEGGEGIVIVQDDVVFLNKDGGALGTECGFYIKTDGLGGDDQPLLTRAVMHPDSILDNVMVAAERRVRFDDHTLTGNGRAVVPAEQILGRDRWVMNLPSLDQSDGLIIMFITRRNTVLPMISRLDERQAAAAFMLGESVESSGGDPTRAGESVRVVGTNPFLVGPEAEEGNWFHDFLVRNRGKVECYLLNTGGVGEVMSRGKDGRRHVVRPVDRVAIAEVASFIRGVCREDIEWIREPLFDTMVPVDVPGVDMSRFDPQRFYSEAEVESMAAVLQKERDAFLRGFPDLHPDVMDVYRGK